MLVFYMGHFYLQTTVDKKSRDIFIYKLIKKLGHFHLQVTKKCEELKKSLPNEEKCGKIAMLENSIAIFKIST